MADTVSIAQGNQGITKLALAALNTRPILSGETLTSLASAQESITKLALISAPIINIPDTSRMIRPMLENIEQTSQLWHHIQVQTDLAKSIATSFHKLTLPALRLNFRFDERFVVDTSPAEMETEVTPADTLPLEVTIDQYGRFTIGDLELSRANANSSRHGQLLSLLEGNKGELISKQQIKTALKVTNAEQVLRDLKKDLRHFGLKLDYKPYPRQGIVYQGVLKKQ